MAQASSNERIPAMVRRAIDEASRDPGKHAKYLLTAEGEPLSLEAAKRNLKEIEAAHGPNGDPNSAWRIDSVNVNMENADLSCSHLSIPIECVHVPDADPVKAAEHWYDGQSSGLYRFQCNGGVPDLDTAECAMSEAESILDDPAASAPKTVRDRVDYDGLAMLVEECRSYIEENAPPGFDGSDEESEEDGPSSPSP